MFNFFWKDTKEQFDELKLKNLELKKELDYRNQSHFELVEAYEQLEAKKIGLEYALVEANKHIDFLRKELFGSDGD